MGICMDMGSKETKGAGTDKRWGIETYLVFL